MVQVVNYTASKTSMAPWSRLVMVKDKRTHSLLRPTSARAYVKMGTYSKIEIPSYITTENGIMLELSQTVLNDMSAGEHPYDVFATINGVERLVSQGTINVDATEYVTPREDTDSMEIRTKERKDFRQTYAWYDSDGALVQLQSAFMQAKNEAGTTVLDIRWFATTPSEATIIALPATRRGYLAPDADGSFELHISNTNTIAAGEYKYDLHAQDNNGDWDILFSGILVVEESISTEPV